MIPLPVASQMLYRAYFLSEFKLWRKIMAKNSCKKRPCSICRRWFAPDIRQIGRQRTCSPDCRSELHRRQCEDWNNKNRAYHKNNYLSKKLEKIADSTVKQIAPETFFPRQTKPVLPIEIVTTEYGIKAATMLQYLVAQVVNHTRVWSARFTYNLPSFPRLIT